MEQTNRIICGDNLEVLQTLPSESVDLCYIDPPFFSGKNYQVIFGDDEEVRQFDDNFGHVRTDKDGNVKMTAGGLPVVEKDIYVYLEWMKPRLEEIHRVLKSTGSFYLHCDDHASHYIKVMCDQIFGYSKFRCNLVWCYGQREGQHPKIWTKKHDDILLYTKTDKWIFNPQFKPYSESRLKFFNKNDNDGKGLYQLRQEKNGPHKQYLNEMKGNPINDSWIDINTVYGFGSKDSNLGYPTQKPEALLERIIKASSNEGDVVLDAFCYSDDTEVLTHRGWKLFKDIEGDLSYEYLSPSNEYLVEYHGGLTDPHYFCGWERAIQFHKYENEDKLVKFTTDNETEILVSKDHKMVLYGNNGIYNKKAIETNVNEFIPTMTNFNLIRGIVHKDLVEPYNPDDYTRIITSRIIKKQIVSYGRDVYCVSLLPKTDHNLIVRRNEKIFVCGNCGCGTTLAVAKKLNRQFIGIDVSPTACRLMADRLTKNGYIFPLKKIEGLPLTPSEIENLSGWEFQNWINREFGSINGKKGADGGIDGKLGDIPIQVKKYKAGRKDLDEFTAALYRENSKTGIYIALSYSSSFLKEVMRLKRDQEIDIKYFTVQDIFDGKHGEFKADRSISVQTKLF